MGTYYNGIGITKVKIFLVQALDNMAAYKDKYFQGKKFYSTGPCTKWQLIMPRYGLLK